MTELQEVGAINIRSGEHESPHFADKKREYKCPDCEKNVMFKKGKIRRPHFAHYPSDTNCNYYNRPSESPEHYQAKHLMKELVESKRIEFERVCNRCRETKTFMIPGLNNERECKTEHSFKLDGLQKYADTALIKKETEDIIAIFEIYHTHKTKEEDRPEPWFEIEANHLIQQNHSNHAIRIECIRKRICDECIVRQTLEEARRREEKEMKLKEDERRRKEQEKKSEHDALKREQCLQRIKKKQEETRRSNEQEEQKKQNDKERRRKENEERRLNEKKRKRKEEERGFKLKNRWKRGRSVPNNS